MTNRFPRFHLAQVTSLWRPRRYQLERDAITQIHGGGVKAELIVARGLVRFGVFDLAALPAGKRHAALNLQLRRWSPYARTDGVVVWHEGVAQVWCWDAAAMEARINEAGLKPSRTRLLPEPLWYQPISEGFRLLRCQQGVDGQYWQNGRLICSRWWPNSPDAVEWNAFVRDAGEKVCDLPSVTSLAMLPQCWGKPRSLGSAPLDSEWEWAVYAALALSLSLYTVHAWHQYAELKHATEQVQDKTAALRRKLGPQLEARDAALAANDATAEVVRLDRYPMQLDVLRRMTKLLPNEHTFVRIYDYQNGEIKVFLISNTDALSGTQLVEKFETDGTFSDVKTVIMSDPKQVELVMHVAPLVKDEEKAS